MVQEVEQSHQEEEEERKAEELRNSAVQSKGGVEEVKKVALKVEPRCGRWRRS